MYISRVSNAQLRRARPHACQRGLDFLLEAGDQFVVAVDQHLLGFDFGDDGLVGGRM